MPIVVTFNWNPSAITERVALAVSGGLEETGREAHGVWESIAPVSDDPRTSGDLRRMFRTPIMSGEHSVTLLLQAYAKHAKFVEFGTVKMPAQAPLRRTAGAVLPSVGRHIREGLAQLG
jgi:hypothetical protein